jgi:hypothetical protein
LKSVAKSRPLENLLAENSDYLFSDQILAVPSNDDVNKKFPSGLNLIERAEPSCSFARTSSFRCGTDHNSTNPSSFALVNVCPSGERSAALSDVEGTVDMSCLAVAASQTRAVPSTPAVTIFVPSRE